jgi:hypothetical protein
VEATPDGPAVRARPVPAGRASEPWELRTALGRLSGRVVTG